MMLLVYFLGVLSGIAALLAWAHYAPEFPPT